MYKYAQIIIQISHSDIDKVFCYKVPNDLKVELGMRVKIPFGKGNKLIEGYIIGFCNEADIDDSKIKYINNVCDNYPIFTQEMIDLAKWMQNKYYCTLTDCLQCIMPAGIDIKEIQIKYASLNSQSEIDKKLTKAQLQIIDLLKTNKSMSVSEIKKILKISDSPINTLSKNKFINIDYYNKSIYQIPKVLQTLPLNPTPEQDYIINSIKQSMDNQKAETFLIHGITGSGKTEIYLQLIQYTLDIGKQAIVLVPEISLTPQTVSRFAGRFGTRIAVTHSKMSLGERLEQWNRARAGEADIMIGPRSAVFAPFKNLGIIIIDEEHEITYKSENTPKYSAKEVAQKRCTLTNSKLILGSATPSIETYYQAMQNNFKLFEIKERPKNNILPQINIIDMRTELSNGNRSIFSEILLQNIANNLDKKEQTILFLNRRGHSTFVSCRKCGYVAKCTDCSIAYTYHQHNSKLMCHYCGKTVNIPTICPKCGSKYIKYFGVGTQKVEEEIKKLFPNASVMRMDMDTTTKKHSHEQILKSFLDGEIDILIGTQMIAKGHDFPKVTLVGVIAADLSLNSNDFRGAEITFQLLTQVSGRAGRTELLGNVFIQTYNPESYAICLSKSQDYKKFYDEEIALRKLLYYPPFCNIFIFLITGEDEKNVILTSNKLIDILRYYNKKDKFELLGPAPANILKIKKQYRWKIIIKCLEEERLKSYSVYCYNKLKQLGISSDINISLNMNPCMSI